MERIIGSVRSSLLTDAYNSYTALTLPYFESLNTLVDHDTDSAGFRANRTRPSPDGSTPREKLVTRLSSNPTRFEKELRNIVLDLYSESGPQNLGCSARDTIDMDSMSGMLFSSPTNSSTSQVVTRGPLGHHGSNPKSPQTVGHVTSGKAAEKYLNEKDPKRPLSAERQRTAESNLGHSSSRVPFAEGVEAGNAGFAVRGTYVQGESSRIQTVQELRGYLASLQFTDITGPRTHSFSESDVAVTPSFDDSGVHLEFVTSDNEMWDNEPDEVDQPAAASLGQTADDVADGGGKEVTSTSLAVFVKTSPELQVVTNPRYISKENEDRVMETSSGETGQCSWTQSSAVLSSTRMTPDIPDEIPRNTLGNDELYEQLVRERAHLEGKLETLSVEYSNILEERKELQAQVQAMQVKLHTTVELEREIAESQILSVEHHESTAQLETRVAELKRFLEAREVSLSDAEEQLKSSRASVQRLEDRISEFEAEFSTKDVVIASLEEQLNNLKRSLDEVQLQNKDFIREEQVLNADVDSLLKAKTWYQRQLEISKESRIKLQLEVNEYESTVASQNKTVEKLKCDNARTSQQLMETQQKTLEEKARILKHLESVEEDMLHQDAAFKQLQVDKQSVERELTSKIDELKAENGRLGNLSGSAETLELELETLRNDAKAREIAMKKLQTAKEEASQQLKVSRGVNEVNEKKLCALKAKVQVKEKELKSVISEHEAWKQKAQKLEEDKMALELQIKDAEDEKAAFDGAVQMLRLELEKVERRFKLMKRELVSKTKQLEGISNQKDALIHELAVLRDEVGGHVTLLEELRDTLRDRNGTIEGLNADRTRLEEELRVLRDRLRCAQASCADAEQERNDLQERLMSATSQVSHLQEQFHSSQMEKARLEGELETTVRVSADEVNASRAQTEAIRHEMADVQRNLQRELTRRRDETTTLEQQVEFFKGQAKQGKETRENDVKELRMQLEVMKEEREAMEKEFTKSENVNKANINDIKQRYEDQLQKVQAERASLELTKNSAEQRCAEVQEKATAEVCTQKHKVQRLEVELLGLRKTLETRRREIEKMSLVSIELEREKGRLAGIMTSQKALRQHCAKMEESIAQKESILADLQANREMLEKEKELHLSSSNKQISQLQAALKDQRQSAQEIQSSLITERKETTRMKLKLAEREEEVERLMKKLSSTCLEAENLMLKYERCSKELQDCRKNLEMTRDDLRQGQIFSGKLQNELSALRERDQIKDDQVSSLEWEAKQRRKEVDYMKEQLRLSEERQQVELENLRTSCQVAKSEAAFLRNELSEARASKCVYQTKVFEIKDEILTSRQETESTKQELFQARQQLRGLRAAILDASDLAMLKALIDKEEKPSCTRTIDASSSNQTSPNVKRPLSSLQECMSTLRSQICTLQTQMDEHTDAIHTAASSWRNFEKNVKDLQMGSYTIPQRQEILSAERDTS